MTDHRRHPEDFLDEARRARERDADLGPALRDQQRAASRDARAYMDHAARDVVDVPGVEDDHRALMFALAASAGRRGHRPTHDHFSAPQPERVDLITTGRRGYCEVGETRAHRLEAMVAQFGPFIFRARLCVRCRRFAPDEPLDAAA